jgi:HNH endonuclease
MDERTCRSCGETKPTTAFSKGSASCKPCRARQRAEQRKDPAVLARERELERQRYQANREQIRSRKNPQKRAARAADPERARAQERERRARDPEAFRARERARYARDPTVKQERNRRWRETHREYNSAQTAEWYANNIDRARAFAREYRKRNPDQVRRANSIWRQRNGDKLRAWARAWYAAHPERQAANVARRRARQMNAPVCDLTSADWRAILEEYDYRCAYCGISGVLLHREHMTPLCRGGSHTRSNVVPACAPCNFRKGRMTFEEYRTRI